MLLQSVGSIKLILNSACTISNEGEIHTKVVCKIILYISMHTDAYKAVSFIFGFDKKYD